MLGDSVIFQFYSLNHIIKYTNPCILKKDLKKKELIGANSKEVLFKIYGKVILVKHNQDSDMKVERSMIWEVVVV